LAIGFLDSVFFVGSCEIEFAHGHGVPFNFFFGEGEDDSWSKLAFFDKLEQFEEIGSFSRFLLFLEILSQNIDISCLQFGHCFKKLVLSESPSLIDNQVDAFRSAGAYIVLQRHWAVLGIDDMAWLMLNAANPFSELGSVRDCSGEEHVTHILA
jgi:hypothetical protein